MNVSDISLHGLNMIRMNITLSSAGKVICIMDNAEKSLEEVNITEIHRNRYYFMSGVSRYQDFDIDVDSTNFHQAQRMFCKAVSLLPNVEGEDFYKSDPFYLECILFQKSSFLDRGWGLRLEKHNIHTTSISVHSNIMMTKEAPSFQNFTVHVDCSIRKATSSHLRPLEKLAIHSSEGTMPISLSFDVL